MRIDELVWDEWNEDHIQRHGVDPEEVEQAIFDPSTLFLRTRGSPGSRRYVALGLTETGRHLLVALEPFGGGRAYPVTARDMSDGERRRFKGR